MTTDNAKWADTLIHLFAVASRLEGEGQYNLAKLTRAAADSLCRQETHPLIIPSDKDKLTAEVQKVIEALTSMNMSADLLSALKQGSEFMAQGKLSPITATPHPYVCRSCGYVTLSPPAEPCPKCGAFAETFQKFMPNYWFDALHPEAARERLRQTPLVVEKLIEGLSDDVMNQSPSDGGWAIRNTLSHLRDACSIFAWTCSSKRRIPSSNRKLSLHGQKTRRSVRLLRATSSRRTRLRGQRLSVNWNHSPLPIGIAWANMKNLARSRSVSRSVTSPRTKPRIFRRLRR